MNQHLRLILIFIIFLILILIIHLYKKDDIIKYTKQSKRFQQIYCIVIHLLAKSDAGNIFVTHIALI